MQRQRLPAVKGSPVSCQNPLITVGSLVSTDSVQFFSYFVMISESWIKNC